MSNVEEWLRKLSGTAGNVIDALSGGKGSNSQGMGGLFGFHQSWNVRNIKRPVQGIENAIGSEILPSLANITDKLANISSKIPSTHSIAGEFLPPLLDVKTTLTGQVSSISSQITAGFDALRAELPSGKGPEVSPGDGFSEAIGKGFGEFIASGGGGIVPDLSEVVEQLRSMVENVEPAKWAQRIGEEVADQVARLMGRFLGTANFSELAEKATGRADALSNAMAVGSEQLQEYLFKILGKFGIEEPDWGTTARDTLSGILVGVSSIYSLYSGGYKEAMRALSSRPLKAYLNWIAPGELLSAEEYIEAERRGILKEATELDWTDEESLDTHMVKNPPSRRRERFLGALGYDKEHQKMMLELTKYHPSPVELISLAVHEAFKSDDELRIGTFLEEQPGLVSHAEQVGVSDYWLKRLVHSHWQTPSPRMVFEMMQRGVITEDQALSYLQEADWFDTEAKRLMEISYRPITRIDIRRLYSAGMITADEVAGRYRDIGYSPEDADLLAEWTTRDVTSLDRDLTKSDILLAHEGGELTEEEASEYLIDLGYSPDEADVLLAQGRLKAEKKAKQVQGEVLSVKFLQKEITEVKALSELQRLGYNLTQARTVLGQARLRQEKRQKYLSKTDVKSLLSNGMISESEAKEKLEVIGYSPVDVDHLLSLWSLEE